MHTGCLRPPSKSNELFNVLYTIFKKSKKEINIIPNTGVYVACTSFIISFYDNRRVKCLYITVKYTHTHTYCDYVVEKLYKYTQTHTIYRGGQMTGIIVFKSIKI